MIKWIKELFGFKEREKGTVETIYNEKIVLSEKTVEYLISLLKYRIFEVGQGNLIILEIIERIYKKITENECDH